MDPNLQSTSCKLYPYPAQPKAAAGGCGDGGSGRGKWPPKISVGGMMEGPRRRRRLISTKRAARALGLSHKTLQNWRVKGVGPRFVRIVNRVMYDEDEIEQYGQVFQSTSEYSWKDRRSGDKQEDK